MSHKGNSGVIKPKDLPVCSPDPPVSNVYDGVKDFDLEAYLPGEGGMYSTWLLSHAPWRYTLCGL